VYKKEKIVNTDINYIIAYLEKRLPAHQCEEFERNLASSPGFRKEVDEVRFIWQASAELKQHKRIDTAKNWEKVSARIQSEKFRARLWYFARTAAAILILPILALSAFLFLELDDMKQQPVSQIEVTSAYGTVTKALLPDGTEVWLNSGSKLSYPESFRGDRRTVSLSGEAYFKVSADRNNRFDVQLSDGLTVSAYGTEFNINAYGDDHAIGVTLVEGNVEIARAGVSGSKEMTPGYIADYNKASKILDMEETNVYVNTGWKDGKMIFRRAGMTEVTKRLSRHFNVDIRLEGKELYNYEYSATFTTETLEDILKLLKKSAPINYTITEPEQSDDLSFTKKEVIISLRKR